MRRRVADKLPTHSNSQGFPLLGSRENFQPGTYCSEGDNSVLVGSEVDIVSNMTCRDRTTEFMSAARSMQSRQGSAIKPLRKQSPDMAQRSQFTEFAKRIGTDLSKTYSKLEKLTILAKRKSLFDDKGNEIRELTNIIKQDIKGLNKQIAQLQQFVRRNDYNKKTHVAHHSNSVVVSLQSRLALMSNDFKHVLEVRTENLKAQKSRRDQFAQGAVSSTLPPSAQHGFHAGSVLLQEEQSSREIAIDMGQMERRDRLHQQLQLVDDQDAYIQSRASTMESIESTIVELGSIFQQLAIMVKEQEEMVTRIDSNVTDTALNVDAAHAEILKYFQSITSNRWLMIKIFFVLVVFFIVFVVFLA